MTELNKEITALPAAAAADIAALIAQDAAPSASPAGLEEADSESYSIPTIRLLQALSPLVQEAPEGSDIKAGAFYNTATGTAVKELLFIPVHFQRRFIRWSADNSMRGVYQPAAIEAGVCNDGRVVRAGFGLGLQLPDGTVDTLADTRIHYVLMQDSDGGWSPAMFSLNRSQIKHSRKLVTMLRSATVQTPQGPVPAPSFAYIYRARSVKEKNDRGQWFSWLFSREAPVTDPSLYMTARAMHAQLKDSDDAVRRNAEEAAAAMQQHPQQQYGAAPSAAPGGEPAYQPFHPQAWQSSTPF